MEVKRKSKSVFDVKKVEVFKLWEMQRQLISINCDVFVISQNDIWKQSIQKPTRWFSLPRTAVRSVLPIITLRCPSDSALIVSGVDAGLHSNLYSTGCLYSREHYAIRKSSPLIYIFWWEANREEGLSIEKNVGKVFCRECNHSNQCITCVDYYSSTRRQQENLSSNCSASRLTSSESKKNLITLHYILFISPRRLFQPYCTFTIFFNQHCRFAPFFASVIILSRSLNSLYKWRPTNYSTSSWTLLTN